jgi:hypothetical protein
MPLPAHVGAAASLEHAAAAGRLVLQRTGFERPAVHGADHLRELFRGRAPGAGDPAPLILATRQAGQQAHLRPAEGTRDQLVLEAWENAEGLSNPGEATDPAGREPEPPDRIVGQACVADSFPGANDHQAIGDAREHGPQRTPLAAQRDELPVDRGETIRLETVVHHIGEPGFLARLSRHSSRVQRRRRAVTPH